MRRISFLFGSIFYCILMFAGSSYGDQENYPEMMFILDGSGSMWGKAGGEVKITAARKVMQKIIPSLPQEIKIGLTSYGHNRKGDCKDIEVLLQPGSTNRKELLEKVASIQPKGKTPIADSLQIVTNLLKGKEVETTIVLVSDGEETCHADPCGAVQTMKASGIKFILHVVAFDVNQEQKAQLSCLAEEGGGKYYTAADAGSLLAAFEEVQENVEKKVEQAKTATKKATTGLGKLKITIPGQGLVSINGLKLKRVKDNKILKTIKDPQASSIHPLLSGEYELVGAFANSNYKPDSEVSFGTWKVTGGETTEIELGILSFNIADSLLKIPVGAVILTNDENPSFKLVTSYNDNPYYLFKPKPLPPGTYDVSVNYKQTYLYKTAETPVRLVENISIKGGRESTVTLDSGLRLVKPEAGGVDGFELVSQEKSWGSMKIMKASNGDYPLWKTYAVPPGTYGLNLIMEGMDEPLPLTDELVISPGELMEFTTGL